LTRYLVTSALPYANGPIHFGHVAGAYLPADVYVRTLRMLGEDVAFICGTDEHGVAITMRAEDAGQEYGAYVRQWHAEFQRTFDELGIEFDIFSGTSQCPQHVETSQEFFRRLDENGYLERRTTEQLYCPRDEMFLADRYVTGTCYVCGHAAARGDECPSCGTWIDALRLLEPECKRCGASPERRSTTHWYLDLPKLRDEHLGSWIATHDWKPNVDAFIRNMLEDVPQRAITRDMRWGVPVPADMAGDEQDKVLYVWFDAPIGYVSFTKELMERRGTPDAWRAYWHDPETRLVHFIGKDNIPFHCLVFPAMLYGQRRDFVLPWAVPANEFYNLAGGKFNTSEGNTLDTTEFFERYDREATRFYIISSMPETADSEFSLGQLALLNNSALAGNIGNLATRVLKFIAKNFDGVVPALAPEHEREYDELLLEQCGEIDDPATWVQRFRFRKAAEVLVANATVANVFMQKTEPWALRKTDPGRAASALNTLCEYISWLARWMVPFMPGKAQALWAMLGQAGPVAAQPWPCVPRHPGWRSLRGGQPLGTPLALFPRMELPADAAPG
jgi:methionyl-tRNA synthetase